MLQEIRPIAGPMAPAAAFMDLLETAIGCDPGAARRPPPTGPAWHRLTAVVHPFMVTTPGAAGGPLPAPLATIRAARPPRSTADAIAAAAPSQPGRAPRRSSIPFARHLRALSRRQQQALAALVALGARLDHDFTTVDLRRAYRALARAHHPDRHATRDAGERARRARTFVEMTEHYRCLAGVEDRAARPSD